MTRLGQLPQSGLEGHRLPATSWAPPYRALSLHGIVSSVVRAPDGKAALSAQLVLPVPRLLRQAFCYIVWPKGRVRLKWRALA